MLAEGGVVADVPAGEAERGALDAGDATERRERPVQLGRRRELNHLVLRYGLLVLFALVTLYFAISEPTFRSVDNIVSILQSVSTVGIIACGVTVSMVVGGFDLSVGANAGFTVMLCAIGLVLLARPTVAVVPIALAGGLLVGVLNGLLVVRLRIPDLLATLGMLFVVQGAQLLPSRGNSISTGVVLGDDEYDGVFTDEFLDIGRGRIGGEIPVPIVVFAVVAITLWIVLERTRWGRMLYAIGGNAEAARLAGVRVDRAADGRLRRLRHAGLARRDHPRGADRRGRRRGGQLLPARRRGGDARRLRGARGQPPERPRHGRSARSSSA